ncbi:MAG: hypothetical protein HC884_00915 [Chloroflexaceae bacterium]|nr:hypothetical protein [Chloroflexaceae bacterium]
MATPSYHTLSLQSMDLDTLVQVVEDAQQKAANHPKWLTAINTAYDFFLNPPVDTIQIAKDGTALIPSYTSDTTYAANGVCQCQAFAHHLPCWHRAAARILYRYHEALEAEADSLMHQVEAAENRGDWKTYDKLSERWAKVEALLMEMEVA